MFEVNIFEGSIFLGCHSFGGKMKGGKVKLMNILNESTSNGRKPLNTKYTRNIITIVKKVEVPQQEAARLTITDSNQSGLFRWGF